MRIAPVLSTPFRADFDLGQEIKDAISKKLAGKLGNLGADEFVPSAPSTPIMIEKLEITQGEKGIKSTLKTGGVVAGSAVTGCSINDLATKKDSAISKLFNGDDDVHSSSGHNSADSDIGHIESNDDTHDETIDDDADDNDDMDDDD